jgi:phosphate ABC transporter phosphate-binding protein
MGAMSIFHNIPGLPKSGPGSLKVNACIIAAIFKRDIKTWDHADIMALNPDMKVPTGQNIVVYHRVLGSSTTSGVTTYLNAACPSLWPSSQVGKTITWPSDTFEAQGSGQMSSKIAATPYAIGYIDSGHGHEDGLAEVALENKAGTYQTSLEAGAAGIGAAADAAILAGVMPSTPGADFGAVSLHNQGGATTWPIVAISYVYLRKDLTAAGDKACLLKAFLQFIISDEGQALLPAYGAVGIPPAVKTVANLAINELSMPVPVCTAWRFEGSSTDKGTGQQDYVISAKRRSGDEYAFKTLESTVSALASRVVSLEDHGATMLDGSGTTNPSKFFWQVMSMFEARAKPAVKMTYRAVGSGTGQYEFIGRDNGFDPYSQDFGSGDIPIGSTDYTDLKTAGKDIMHVPFQMGAMSIFHNIPGMDKSGAGALKVDACIIAKIFRRLIKTWDNAEIKALNPDLTVPAGQNIEVFHRVLGSSTTGGVTTYLHAACPAFWPANLVGKTITWPSDTNEAQGSGGMSSKIAATPYSIGYIDSGHGHEDGLKEISLKNAAGTSQTSLEAGPAGIGAAAESAITAGVMPSSPLNDFSAVSLHNQNGATAWPIVAISYVYVRKDLTALGQRACLVKAFLEYIISPEGQALLPAFGAVGIPTAVQDIAKLAINELVLPACKPWTFESSTMKGTGQADYVVSAKRRSYDEYGMSVVESTLAALATRVATLEDHKITMLDGSGTTNPSKFFWQVMSIFEARAKPAVKMSYRAVGSGTGQYEFIGKDNGYNPYEQDFGSGDIPIGAADHAALATAGKEIMHIPFQMGAMSVFHNIPGLPKSGAGALKVDACIIAKIFKRVITTWNHAEIKILNPSTDLPSQNIIVFHRVLGSSTTSGITTYLHAACPVVWTADLVGKTITWPSDTQEAQGSGGMSAAISTTPYSIGYIDSGHGHEDGLKEIELKNAAGTYQSSLEAGPAGIGAAADAAIADGVMPMSPLSDFSAVSLHNQGGSTTWPIVAISYVYVRRDLTGHGEKACLLKAFLEYIISEEGQALLPSYGAVGIPTKVKTIAQSAINLLTMPACKAWTFEGSTMKGTGQTDYVISKKRRSYYEYADDVTNGDVTALKSSSTSASSSDFAALQAEVAALKAQLNSTDEKDDVIGIIALVVACIAVALGAILCILVMRTRKSTTPLKSDGQAIGNTNQE